MQVTWPKEEHRIKGLVNYVRGSSGLVVHRINRDVLLICKSFENESIQLIYLDTNHLESLDPNLFYTQFHILDGLKIEIWLRNGGEIEA